MKNEYCTEWILSSCGKKECCCKCDAEACKERCSYLPKKNYMICGSLVNSKVAAGGGDET